MQAVGFHGPPEQFFGRLTTVAEAYAARFSLRPSPKLALQIATNLHVLDDVLPHLFDLPTSRRAARVTALAATAIDALTHEPQSLAARIDEAGQAGRLDEFLRENDDELDAALEDFETHRPVALAVWKARQLQRARMRALALENPQLRELVEQGWELHEAGLGAEFAAAAGGVTRTVAQIGLGLTLGLPMLALEEGRAVKESAEERSLTPFARAQVQLARQVIEGVSEDFTNPEENAGYVFLDFLGFGAGGAGLVARLGAATRAKGPRARGRALVTRPKGGLIAHRKGDAVEWELGSENMLVNLLQRFRAYGANRRIEAERRGDRAYPAGLLSIVRPMRAQDELAALLSTETKIGRLAAARRRVEVAVAEAPRKELEWAAGRADEISYLNRRFRAVRDFFRRGLTVGEQKLIQVLATDDPRPFATWQRFHETMIELGFGDAAEHRAQLAALDLAANALANPSKRLTKAMPLAARLTAEMQQLKIDELGLSPVAAQQRIAAVGDILRTAGAAKTKAQVEAALLPDVGEIAAEIRQLEGLLRAKHVEERRPHVEKYPASGVARRIDELVDTLEQARGRRERLTPVTEEGAYSPFEARARTRKETRSDLRRQAAVRPGPTGIPAPDVGRYVPELQHSFTGRSIVAGDFRIDATNLIGEAYGRTVRAVSLLSEHARLWGAATDSPQTPFDIPIRDVKAIPQRLRERLQVFEEGVLTRSEEKALSTADLDALRTHLFPGRKDDRGRWQFDPEETIDGVRWVDGRLVLDVGSAPVTASRTARAAQSVFQIANEIPRVLMLFVRPAYGLNIPSNAGMLAFQQGPFMVPNMARSLRARDLYGERVVAALDELVGQGRHRSYVNKELETRALASGRALAELWHRLADGWMRRAALIHEIHRQGYKGREGFERFLFGDGDELAAARVEATRRANKAMVQFDNLTEFEKAWLRNFVFVYPWVSRSIVWSLRTVFEHPVKTRVLAELGRDVQEDPEWQNVLSRAPEWFQRAGYFPLGFDEDGNPTVVNVTQLSAFSTLGEVLAVGEGAFADEKPYAAVHELLGPAAKFLMLAASGRDEYGNELPGPDFIAAAREIAETLPQYRAYERGKKPSPERPPVDPTDRRTLIERRNAALERIALSPGWANGWGLLVSGGLTPREVDRDALIARYWRDQPPKARHDEEMRLIRAALRLQAKLLGRKLPQAVAAAVDLAGAEAWAQNEFARDHGRTPTDREKDELLLTTLRDAGRIDQADTERLSRQADGLREQREHERFRQRLKLRYANGLPLAEWDADVRLVASFRRETLQHKIDVLAQRGIVERVDVGKIDEKALYDLGRRFLRFRLETEQRATLADDAANEDLARAELVRWEDEQDRPIKVDGVMLPSFVRVAWAHLTETQRRRTVRGLVSRSWETLSAFEKELLGRTVSPDVNQGWALLEDAKARYRDAYPGERITQAQLRAGAKQIDKEFPGFFKEWLFANEPAVRRFELLRPYREMPEADRAKYDAEIGASAKIVLRALASEEYEQQHDELRAAWEAYITEQVRPWLAQPEQASLRQYLDAFGEDFLVTLIAR